MLVNPHPLLWRVIYVFNICIYIYLRRYMLVNPASSFSGVWQFFLIHKSPQPC